MTPDASSHGLALASFEALDAVADEQALDALRRELEARVVESLTHGPGLAELERLIGELNELGHAFQRRDTNEGWASWFQETNGGERHFWIHVERTEIDVVMVLYQETLEVSVARRRSELSPSERAREARTDSFYDRCLDLVQREPEDGELSPPDRRLLRLYLLDTGVNSGGFHTYIMNTEGMDLPELRDDLSTIGAPGLAAVVGEVIALIPGLGSGLTEEAYALLDQHAAALEALDQRYYEADENIALLALDYVERQESDPAPETRA